MAAPQAETPTELRIMPEDELEVEVAVPSVLNALLEPPSQAIHEAISAEHVAEGLLPESRSSRPIPEEMEVPQPQPASPPDPVEEEEAPPSPVPSMTQPDVVTTTAPQSTAASVSSVVAQPAATIMNEIMDDMATPVLEGETIVFPAPEMPEEPAVLTAQRASSSSLAPTITALPAITTAPSIVAQEPMESEIKEMAEPSDVQAAAETVAGLSPAMLEAADSVSLKRAGTLPKVAAEAAAQAGQAYVEASKEARTTLRDLLSLREKEGPPVTLTVDQIATAAFLVLVALQLLLVPIFMPSTFRLIYSLGWGIVVGLGLSFLFYFNRKKKTEANELLGINLGLKGVQLVAAGVPSMFNLSDTEKMEWLNALVVEVWPFIDKGICEMIKDKTSQAMPGILASLPPALSGLVKSVGFKHLTFGDAPFRVESIWVSPETSEGLLMELSVKWCGDPNITLAIEIGTGQKLCPRIMDISVVATLRVVLSPLVPRLPGFVAAMATVPKSPLIKYRLDFGKALGGSMAPAAVTPIINYFLHDVIDRMLVWPARLVIPIIQETPQDTISIQRLMRRHRGVLRVFVVRGKDLKDVAPTDSACIECTTDSIYYESTRPKAAVTLMEGEEYKPDKLAAIEPIRWNDFIYLLLQEPENQLLRMEAYDLTAIRAGKVSFGGRRFVGRALIKLNKICKAGMKGDLDPVPVRIQLGKSDWGSPGGPGKGNGKVLTQMTYFPCERFTREQVVESKRGIVTFRLSAIRGLKSTNGSVTAYASVNTTALKLDGKASWRSSKKAWTAAAHTAQLNQKISKLSAERERDIRGGKLEDAAKKEEQLKQMQAELDGGVENTHVVNLNYIMDMYCLHAFYNVTEKLENSDEDNRLIIKVTGIGGGRKPAETIAAVEIPISEIKNSCDVNPMTGNREHGFHLRPWQGYNPDKLGTEAPETEWGLPLEGPLGYECGSPCAGCHVLRADVPDEDDDPAFERTLPSALKPVESAFPV